MLAFQPVRKGGFQSARVAELVDALDSGSSTRKGVQVRVLSRAPSHDQWVTGELPRPVDNPRYPMNEGGDKMVTNTALGSATRPSAKRSIPRGRGGNAAAPKAVRGEQGLSDPAFKGKHLAIFDQFLFQIGVSDILHGHTFFDSHHSRGGALWPRIMKTGSMRMEP